MVGREREIDDGDGFKKRERCVVELRRRVGWRDGREKRKERRMKKCSRRREEGGLEREKRTGRLKIGGKGKVSEGNEVEGEEGD